MRSPRTTSWCPTTASSRQTLFLELRSDAELREWLPKLIGIDRCVALVLADGTTIAGEPLDEERLNTRRRHRRGALPAFPSRICGGQHRTEPVKLCDAPEYSAETVLTAEQHAELISDLGASALRN